MNTCGIEVYSFINILEGLRNTDNIIEKIELEDIEQKEMIDDIILYDLLLKITTSGKNNFSKIIYTIVKNISNYGDFDRFKKYIKADI